MTCKEQNSDDLDAILPGPEWIIVYICDRCQRKALVSNSIRPGHYRSGERCGGTIHAVEYAQVARQALSKSVDG